jgi:hypothetical protein
MEEIQKYKIVVRNYQGKEGREGRNAIEKIFFFSFLLHLKYKNEYTVRSISFRTDFFLNNRTRVIYRPTH